MQLTELKAPKCARCPFTRPETGSAALLRSALRLEQPAACNCCSSAGDFSAVCSSERERAAYATEASRSALLGSSVCLQLRMAIYCTASLVVSLACSCTHVYALYGAEPASALSCCNRHCLDLALILVWPYRGRVHRKDRCKEALSAAQRAAPLHPQPAQALPSLPDYLYAKLTIGHHHEGRGG
jgi:hypothetical protein